MVRFGAFVCVAMAVVAACSAQVKAPTIDQSLEMQSVAAPQISPDGRHVIYEQTRTNWETNAFETELWIADTATGKAHRLTLEAKSSSDAAWSPDGSWIAFLSDRVAPMPGSPAGKKQMAARRSS
jgi:dipeptidyl aminopeptidase/acylaminoacyl peptidase